MSVVVHIENIFPIPIYTSFVDVDDVDVSGIKFLDNGPPDKVLLSESNILLEEKRYSNLKSRIDEHMHHFYYDVFGFTKQTYPEMVSSWAVKSLPSQESGWHVHGNSIFSGVVYLNAGDNCGKLLFRKETPHTGILEAANQFNTIYNHLFHSIAPTKGMLVLFPSYLFHKVDKNQSNFERLSIAFNYFIKGDFPVRVANLTLR